MNTNIQNEINETQYKIYETAKWSNKKNRFRLKEKHLRNLEDQIREYVEDACSYNNTEEENTLVQWITTGAIEEVLKVLNDKRYSGIMYEALVAIGGK